MYGYVLNSSTILNTLGLGYKLAEPFENQVIGHLHKQAVAHFDETDIRVKGKLLWLHIVSTVNYTHLFVHKKRGTEALESKTSVLKDFKGKAVHVCW